MMNGYKVTLPLYYSILYIKFQHVTKGTSFLSQNATFGTPPFFYYYKIRSVPFDLKNVKSVRPYTFSICQSIGSTPWDFKNSLAFIK